MHLTVQKDGNWMEPPVHGVFERRPIALRLNCTKTLTPISQSSTSDSSAVDQAIFFFKSSLCMPSLGIRSTRETMCTMLNGRDKSELVALLVTCFCLCPWSAARVPEAFLGHWSGTVIGRGGAWIGHSYLFCTRRTATDESWIGRIFSMLKSCWWKHWYCFIHF